MTQHQTPPFRADHVGSFLPKGKIVVLGLVTTKVGTMESKEAREVWGER